MLYYRDAHFFTSRTKSRNCEGIFLLSSIKINSALLIYEKGCQLLAVSSLIVLSAVIVEISVEHCTTSLS